MRPASAFVIILLAACAAAPPRVDPGAERAAGEKAAHAIAVGNTKAQVRAALGEGQVIPFDSGYEVWLYRFGNTELVLLFEPSGQVAKSRLRARDA